MPENFHFLEPGWFYMLIPLVIILFLLRRSGNSRQDPWQKVINSEFMPWLRVKNTGKGSRLPIRMLAAGWFITVFALANPVWEKLPQPVFQTDLARVIVLDLSHSMVSTDLKPSRLERAHFKVTDILADRHEGVTGLVVFAGDAFVVAPLTRDTDTISAMLPALKPGIMPVQGSRADLGLAKAGELLKQAGRLRGEILLIADSYTDRRTLEEARKLRKQGIITSVLGIGTPGGAPLPSGQSGFIRDREGKIVTTRLDVPAMQELARAGGGDYVSLSADNADINLLMTPRMHGSREQKQDIYNETTRWKETGPWLVLLLLPLALAAFRRGWLVSVALLLAIGIPARPAMAYSLDDLWQRQDQQAHRALLEGDSKKAAELAENPMRKGAAEFRQGDYQEALDAFSQASGPDADYNRGNALARLGKYAEAIDAYEKALETRADMDDARYNKELLEKLLKQQQEQQQKDQASRSGDNEDKQNQQNQQDSKGQTGQQDHQQSSSTDDSQENKQQQESASQQQKSNGQSGKQDQQQQKGQDGNVQEADQQESQQASSAQNADEKDSENAFAEAAEKAGRQDEQDSMNQQEASSPGEQEKTDAASSDEKEQAKTTGTPGAGRQPAASSRTDDQRETEARELTSEEQIAAEQWLRRIPDDPAGLLRRKLRYQYIQRGGQANTETQPW